MFELIWKLITLPFRILSGLLDGILGMVLGFFGIIIGIVIFGPIVVFAVPVIIIWCVARVFRRVF